jgi:hypothetical protein
MCVRVCYCARMCMPYLTMYGCRLAKSDAGMAVGAGMYAKGGTIPDPELDRPVVPK